MLPAQPIVTSALSLCAAALLGVFVPAVTSAQVVITTPTPRAEVVVQRPRGWIGIRYSGDQRVELVNGKLLVSFAAYPVIESVETGSPAERAGLAAGDTILAYNDHDLRSGPYRLYDHLIPGTKFRIRVRRNGATRNVAVVLGQRPGQAPVAYGYRYSLDPEMQEQIRLEIERAREDVRRAREEVQRELEENRDDQREDVRREIERAQRQLERTAATAATATTPLAFTMGATSAVAGAEVTPLNPDLSDLLGVNRGVFVVRVGDGTPARNAGLRGGDVIISAGDSRINDVRQLRRAIDLAQREARRSRGDRGIPLEVVRKHRKHKLILSW